MCSLNPWGPSLVKYYVRCQYILTFIDDYSRKFWVYFLKTKDNDEVLGGSRSEILWLKNRVGANFSCLGEKIGWSYVGLHLKTFVM